MKANSSQPTALNNLDNLPDELKECVQWVVASNLKVPIHARIGVPASTTNPGTWSSYGKAREAVNSGKYKYIGFVFTKNDPYVGIDLDHVIDLETGKIEPWAQAIIDLLDSYTEISQSGTGIHIIVRGKKPGIKCKRGDVEIYEKKRYFALTGNLLDEAHTTIEDRQEQLDTLYVEIFGKGAREQGGEPVSEGDYDISDLVFERNAKPPRDKLKKALRSDKFRKTWEHRRDNLTDDSLSGYDESLAGLTVGYGWDDQEIVNLGIAFSREHGDEKDLTKRLRPDYWRLTLSKARGVSSAGGLGRLQSEIKEIVLYGADEEGEFIIEVEGGRFINMGDVSSFLSPSRAYQRLYIAGYVLSPQEKKQWPQTVRDWRQSIRIEATATKLGDFEQWMMNDVSRGATNPPIIAPEDLSRSLSGATDNQYIGVGTRGYAVDDDGRLYVHIPSILSSAQMSMGRHLSGKRIAGYLKRIKFEAIENVRIHREDYHHNKYERKITVWVSQAGFAPKNLYIGREAAAAASQADKELYLQEEGSVPVREEPTRIIRRRKDSA